MRCIEIDHKSGFSNRSKYNDHLAFANPDRTNYLSGF